MDKELLKYALAAVTFVMAGQTNAQSPRVINPYEAAAQREGEQAVRDGRFPELKSLTNSKADQMKALQICQNLRLNLEVQHLREAKVLRWTENIII
jgi:hypothetical protein